MNLFIDIKICKLGEADLGKEKKEEKVRFKHDLVLVELKFFCKTVITPTLSLRGTKQTPHTPQRIAITDSHRDRNDGRHHAMPMLK